MANFSDIEAEERELFEQAKAEAHSGQRRQWPFNSMDINDYMRINEREDFQKAMAAARQAGRRNGWKFAGKYHDQKGFGIIGRTA